VGVGSDVPVFMRTFAVALGSLFGRPVGASVPYQAVGVDAAGSRLDREGTDK
jgi:hypothetical protein